MAKPFSFAKIKEWCNFTNTALGILITCILAASWFVKIKTDDIRARQDVFATEMKGAREDITIIKTALIGRGVEARGTVAANKGTE